MRPDQRAAGAGDLAVRAIHLQPPRRGSFMMQDVGVRQRPSEETGLSGDCLAARFEQQVAMAPDQMAILTDRGEVTYRELDSMANGVAAMLRSGPAPIGNTIAQVCARGLATSFTMPIVNAPDDRAMRAVSMMSSLRPACEMAINTWPSRRSGCR